MSEKLSEADRALLNANPILGTTLWMLERGQEVILQPSDARTITTAFAALLNAARAEARPAPAVDREAVARWRNDAFQKSAEIVRRYFGEDADDCVHDILALLSPTT